MSKHSRNNSQPDLNKAAPIFTSINRGAIGLIHVVCPLLFFTNLTRNPYYTQIALLHIGIALVIFSVIVRSLIRQEKPSIFLSIQWPLLAFLAWALLSTLVSWWDHVEVRPGILFESIRVWIFTIVNCVFAFFLPLYFSKPFSVERKPLNIWADVILASIWSLLWIWFHPMKDSNPAQQIWDPYGALLWGGAIAYALWRTLSGRMEAYFHVIFAVAIGAGLYGLSQYMGRDFIWSGTVTPYGGRPVSSFGNPNFLSSYVMMVVPISLAFALQSRHGFRLGYTVVALISTLSTLSTLTRSSYVGLISGLIVLVFLLARVVPGLIKKAVLAFLIILGLIVIFPRTPVISTQSPSARFTEILQAKKAGTTYAPWHQRLLIWSSAKDMVVERPLLGKGWGCFELFYPFYQGRYLLDAKFAPLRTHANNAHNILLELLSQIGVVGTGLAVWILAALLWTGLVQYRVEVIDGRKIIIAGLLASLVAMVTDNFFGNVSVFFAVPAFLFWWVAGVLIRECQPASIPPSPSSSQGLSFGMAVVMIVMGLVCIGSTVYFVQRWNQERYYFEGFKLSRLDRIADSVHSLEKAFQWFPGEVNGNYELGNSYARLSRLAAEQNRAEEAIKWLEKSMNAYEWALKANPGYDEIYFNLGITQLQTGRQAAAIKSLETAVLINPLLQSAYNSLGSFYLQNAKFIDAVRLYEQAVRAFPKEKDYWNNMGYAYAQLNDQQKAYDNFSRAVELDPSFNNARVNLMTTAQKLGKPNPFSK